LVEECSSGCFLANYVTKKEKKKQKKTKKKTKQKTELGKSFFLKSWHL
jgi:hypothetical protein